MQAEELTEQFDPFQLPPGAYVVRATSPAYGVLDAMIAAGDAQFVGERWDSAGQKWRAAIVGGDAGRSRVPNQEESGEGETVEWGFGEGFFTSALEKYRDWREKWWREAIQNSVDAHATRVICTSEETPDGMVISIDDDGDGMSETTLKKVFVTSSGTTKMGFGSAGGFGAAKELLVMPWPRWEVHSRDRMLRAERTWGAGEFPKMRVAPAPERRGTRLTVTMPLDNATDFVAAIAYIGKCYLPSVRFEVNGKVVEADLANGVAIRGFPGDDPVLQLYYDKEETRVRGVYLVRVNGLYMFDESISTEIKGQIIFELLKPSKQVLTDNRDALRYYSLREEVGTFVASLAGDATSKLKPKKPKLDKKYKGTGKFTAMSTEQIRSTALENLGRMEPAKRSGKKYGLSGEQIAVLTEVMREFGGAEQPERDVPDGTDDDERAQDAPPLNFRPSAELTEAMLDGTEIRGSTHIEAVVKQLAWEPDFWIENEWEDVKPATLRKFMPETMSPKVRKLVRFWAEVNRLVLIKLGSAAEYGVGLVLNPDKMADYAPGENWLRLNPIKNAGHPDHGEMYSLADPDDVAEIFAEAVHECTHFADGIHDHFTSYASALTRNIARTYGSERQVEKIRKQVVARGARGPRREGGAGRAPRRTSEPTGHVDRLPGGIPAGEHVADAESSVSGWHTVILRTERNPIQRHMELFYAPRGSAIAATHGGPAAQEVVRFPTTSDADITRAFRALHVQETEIPVAHREAALSRVVRKDLPQRYGGYDTGDVYNAVKQIPGATWSNFLWSELSARYELYEPAWDDPA